MPITQDLDRWFYRGGHPNRVARVLNRFSAVVYGAGIWPSRVAALEVTGRRTGRTIKLPVVIAEHEGERYLVSMLGDRAGWVRNVRAARGRAVLRHGRREAVRLDDVDVADRPPVIKRYLAVAPGARGHIPVGRNAPVEDFVQVAAQIPVFRITNLT